MPPHAITAFTAGDTAQTISNDSTFRFPDVKTLFFDHFSAVGESMHQPMLARPKQMVLTKNYRSHNGILSVASVVMKMLNAGNSFLIVTIC